MMNIVLVHIAGIPDVINNAVVVIKILLVIIILTLLLRNRRIHTILISGSLNVISF